MCVPSHPLPRLITQDPEHKPEIRNRFRGTMMSNLTRREWNKLMLGTLAGSVATNALPTENLLSAPEINSTINSVTICAQKYSFCDPPPCKTNERPTTVGVGAVE